jgi:hypothetical protein
MTAEQTKTDLVKLAWREIQLTRERASIEREVGLLLVNNETPSGDAAGRIARATAELQANEAGIKASQTKRLELIRARRESEVRTLQDRRAEFAKERTALLSEIEKHKAALIELLGVGIAVVTTSGSYSKPDVLGLKLTGLDNQIGQLQAPLSESGFVDIDNATTTDPLVEALAASEAIIPPMASVLEWIGAVEPVPGETFRDLPRRIHLVWANGAIDYKQSTVVVGALCAPGRIGMYSGKPMGVNIESGTFRARTAARP